MQAASSKVAADPASVGARMEVMRHSRGRRTLHLPLLVVLALVAGLRTGTAAPASAPLPLSPGPPPGAAQPAEPASLAHATFAVG